MQGHDVKSQKIIARGKGWEPDSLWNPETGKYEPLDAGLTAPAEIFTNQGVPMTKDVYGPPMIGSSAIDAQPEGEVLFNHPTPRNLTNNAPVPGKHGDPYAGFNSGGK
jgi:hypothetical protein